MTDTPRLLLPLLAAGQAQKHVTHNDALIRLDGLINLTVDSRTETAPPALPTELSAYIVPAGGTGAFAGRTDQVALFEDGGWTFLVPRAGWQAWVIDEAEHNLWTGTEWRRGSPLSSLGAERWGVNATADTTNRLAVSSEASLFNHAGNDHRLKINKNAAGNTASLLFQSNWSGRAEFGLAGDDDFRVKVSADGSAWHDALAIDRASGSVALPTSSWAAGMNLLVNGDMTINQRGFAGGALAAGAYGFDRWKAATGGANLSVSGFAITLTSGAIIQPVEPALWGLSSLASLPLTLSVEDLTGGSLAVTIGSQSGTIIAGAGRRSVTLTPAVGDTGVLPDQAGAWAACDRLGSASAFDRADAVPALFPEAGWAGADRCLSGCCGCEPAEPESAGADAGDAERDGHRFAGDQCAGHRPGRGRAVARAGLCLCQRAGAGPGEGGFRCDCLRRGVVTLTR